MIERLLLDWINAEAARAAVRRQHDRVVLSPADEAQSALSFMQPAVARAHVALHAAVIQDVPVLRRHCVGKCLEWHCGSR